MATKRPSLDPGVAAALAAAVLFGASTPLAKPLLGQTSPWLLAALLYLGSGLGLWLLRRLRRAPAVRLESAERWWLAGAIVAGGMVAPVLLMLGLSRMPASGVSLLLNAEGVATALLAWFAFKENFDRRIALGMLAIVAGSVVLTWPGSDAASGGIQPWWPALAVLGACLAWGLDNNLTRKVSLTDASYIAMSKGLAAGATNLVLALIAGAQWPGAGTVLAAGLLGFASYGASLVLFVLGLRHLGTARTGAYFSVAPFIGAMLSILLLDEPVTGPLLLAGLLMAIGVALHLTERHEHEHRHEPMEHEHTHVHGTGDLHHAHEHDPPVPPGTRHTHGHRHEPMTHSHGHFPDAHHRHEH
ncbi:DMT family transporter [Roseateles toxinivorans]|uniref:Drug/metabolite transporter (DMT)-like permease n=1 Tax=Roseateles toxinivorans TaxID=270368 RepID=A0A4R6QIH9_9BURK|nr:DMT family transporter [Roseateles toxinivorans]TDP63300.1 drug/metabolite transporter (DMT)-like permease [Roseateles toxinivorans]